ncbi:MAG TPA: hypothetical protein VFZ89_18400, partial [Solirubrobacteraceae bacterium]
TLADVAVVRPLVVLAAVLLVPGGALVLRMRVDEQLAAVGIAVGLSLAIVTLVATLAAVTHWWHPELLAAVVAAAAAALLVTDLRRVPA